MKFVGEIIRKRRLAKKISLEKIAEELNISKDILTQIEADEVNKNIYDVYLLGHLRSLSSYLDLNSDEIVNSFKIQNPINSQNQPDKIPKPILRNNNAFLTKSFSFASIVIIFTAFYFLFIDVEKTNRDYALIPDLPENYLPIIEKTQIEINKIQNEKKIEEKNMINSERIITSSSAIAALNESNNYENHLITLKILNPTWLQVRDKDEKIIISKLMNEDEEFTYEFNLKYSITSGNAGSILVLINNNVKGRIGSVGEVVDSFVIDSNFVN